MKHQFSVIVEVEGDGSEESACKALKDFMNIKNSQKVSLQGHTFKFSSVKKLFIYENTIKNNLSSIPSTGTR